LHTFRIGALDLDSFHVAIDARHQSSHVIVDIYCAHSRQFFVIDDIQCLIEVTRPVILLTSCAETFSLLPVRPLSLLAHLEAEQRQDE
jgi:hypothetical protein